MNKTIPLRFTYRVDWQETVHCETAREAFDRAQEALLAMTSCAGAEIRDAWTGAQLAAFARTDEGQIIDVPF